MASSVSFVERAIDLLTQATTADKEGRKTDAIALYTKGVEYLFAANRYEKVEATRKVIQQKLDTYISRAEQLKKDLAEEQKPKSLSASSAVDSRNTSAGDNSSTEPDKPKSSWSISRESTVGLEEKLRDSVVGQGFAIRSVLAAVHRWASGWVDPQRPLVWLFVGPSGVGKTELSKALANALFSDDKDAMIRVDMSEYQDKSMVNKFLGAAPGYVGFGEGGALVNALEAREGKGSIVLLDEVEKAHTDILTVLLQVFDEGRITNSKGRTIDCRQSIFIMTSNVGAEEIASLGGQLRAASSLPPADQVVPETVIVASPSLLTAEEELVRAVEPRLKEQFKRDEFIGRISEIVPFLPFNDEELRAIAGLILRKWAKVGVERHSIRLEWDATVVNALAKEYNPKYGVRSLRNLFEKKVLSQLADWTMRGAIQPGDIVRLHIKSGASEITPLVTGRDPTLIRPSPGPSSSTDSSTGPAIKA
eukprot:TRINITY_DN8594_c0_g1_i1.p1 TRINITY_DN8594_c0_g1~~TRINITY_DN8594_c0_g1_i1.p1  ORF type:complete len:485 (-),score=86.33 TRINITY_DN8594_c0_g1_i1:159-1589(-)